ncbi:MAG: hypothetical protein QNK23_17925 [Crocinitomicaceae bacterium]|nr:hypothetical protein [Crocinitomicaceae bacterium]
MKFFNFSIEGENVQKKIQNLTATRYPEYKLYINNTIICFSTIFSHTEFLAVFAFNYEGNPNLAQVNIGSTDKEKFSVTHELYERYITHAEYKFFKEWCETWKLKISEPKSGVHPEMDNKIDFK